MGCCCAAKDYRRNSSLLLLANAEALECQLPNRKNNEWSAVLKLSPTPTSILFRAYHRDSGNRIVPEFLETTKHLRVH